jgi:hypothetical protein
MPARFRSGQQCSSVLAGRFPARKSDVDVIPSKSSCSGLDSSIGFAGRRFCYLLPLICSCVPCSGSWHVGLRWMALLGALSYFGRGRIEPKTRAERVGDGAPRRRGPMVARDGRLRMPLIEEYHAQVGG